jgi:hypothetical protein
VEELRNRLAYRATVACATGVPRIAVAGSLAVAARASDDKNMVLFFFDYDDDDVLIAAIGRSLEYGVVESNPTIRFGDL